MKSKNEKHFFWEDISLVAVYVQYTHNQLLNTKNILKLFCRSFNKLVTDLLHEYRMYRTLNISLLSHTCIVLLLYFSCETILHMRNL